MSTLIDITHSKKYLLPSFDETAAKNIKQKGWSFSYVYNFSEIRDIYIVLREIGFNNLNSFSKHCYSISLPTVKTPWNSRRILEHLNALKNFELIDENYRIIRDVFTDSIIGNPVTDTELGVFREIYFSYFRFKEIFTWFIDPRTENREIFIDKLTEDKIVASSRAIFCFSDKSRFTDSFFFSIENNPEIFFIDLKSGEDLMRFWDVFVKWGISLGILEKFNLRNLDIKTITNKGIACTYVLSRLQKNFSLIQFINENYSGTYIYIPALVLDIAIKFRWRIEEIHNLIIEEYRTHKEYLSFERTSEIFIKKGDIKLNDKIFFPKYNDSYVSHLIIRR